MRLTAPKRIVTGIIDRLRVNLRFTLLVGVIIVAALFSLTYAFMREGTPLPVTEAAASTEGLDRVPEKIEELAMLDDESGSEVPPTENNTGTATVPKNSTAPGITLGESINCLLEDNKLSQPVKWQEEKLKGATLLSVEALYAELLRLHNSYAKQLSAKGCAPSLKVNYTLNDLWKKLLRDGSVLDIGNILG